MRGFLIKLSIALALALAAHLVAGLFADGRTDDYYLRFTGVKCSSMIIGTSRAAQGVRPVVIMPLLDSSAMEGSLFNYAFTIAHSPFGATYLRAIEAKLDPRSRNGLFIVTVDPWSLSLAKVRRDDLPLMREDDRSLGEQWTFTGTPNYEYLVRHTTAGWGSLMAGPMHDMDTLTLLHTDGWIEIKAPIDTATVRDRTKHKVEHYRKEMLAVFRPAEERVAYLDKIVDLLKPHGHVFLVRLPVCDAIEAMEDSLWPGFSGRIQSLAGAHSVPFWDLMPSNDQYTYVDGNHLDTASARAFSSDLGLRLAASLQQGR